MANFSGVIFTLFAFLALSQAAPHEALITSLPGFSGSFPSPHYSGYVTVDETLGKNLFYYFVVSERNPLQDPIVLWLNGGPGCSSLNGFIYEHGPFSFQAANQGENLPQLQLNPYSWSKVSSIIYLDSPAGVGFSYSSNKTGYITNDTQTAANTHAFLLQWFKLYPEFVSNAFYISGESYAGVYIPTLASEILKGLDDGVLPILNFKGYMVGNGATATDLDHVSKLAFARGMGLISEVIFQEIGEKCHENHLNESACVNLLDKLSMNIRYLNPYNILEPCYHDHSHAARNHKLPMQLQFYTGVGCMNYEIARSWLNDHGVRKALHTEQLSTNENVTWEPCADKLFYEEDLKNMIVYHKNLTARGLRVMIYSGDHDFAVPYTGSEAWTSSMGSKIVDEWRPWIVDQQVAGFTQGYENNLTFVTVKGAGHKVPQYKPREALAMYTRWLAGENI